ncbi:hypothetical protein CDO73_09295 [Saccharibacillus sp. O23]|uniref:patatin-like phospholipase family protein n=1 Tax=Saccharibacillus sp. O23 TaxID=2009338 RepID=UPI000B4E25BA|nr:patatin-like phospholipase family protein [Saccharibacillus sp. O23]OWR30776.1 hypothetical protein CDO73_09295 [Saccharibacillus sp. O23]
MHPEFDFGFVLSGGGARGAYEIGVAQYLAQEQLIPSAYSGASIGALNAAFLSNSAASFEENVRKLDSIWRSLEVKDVVKINKKFIGLGLLYAMLKKSVKSHPALLGVEQLIKQVSQTSKVVENVSTASELLTLNPLYKRVQNGLLDNQFLKDLLNHELNLGVSDAKKTWISVYESNGLAKDLSDYTLAKLRVRDTTESKYILLNEIPFEQKLSVILASAAIPAIYDSQTIGDKGYIDGGVGGTWKASGNTPIAPLISAGFEICVVAHLSDASFFDRHEFKDTTIIEIRPESSLHPNGLLSSMFDFRAETIDRLIEQGYADAKRCISRSLKSVMLIKQDKKSREVRQASLEQIENDDFESKLKLLD